MKKFALGLIGLVLSSCTGPSVAVATSSPDKAPHPVISASPPRGPAALDSATKTKYLYYPNDQNYGPRPDGADSLRIVTGDGVELDAWYRAATERQPLVLFFHGNGGNLTSLGEQLEAITEAEAGFLAIDYRGFGQSGGTPSEEGLYLDSEAAYDKAIELGLTPERIVIFGRSLGGGVATNLAAEKSCAGLVLESTFTSVTDVARQGYGAAAAALVHGFPSLERMPKIDAPTLILHGTADETIPYAMGQQLQAASAHAELWTVEGATHNNLRQVAGREAYVKRLHDFLQSL